MVADGDVLDECQSVQTRNMSVMESVAAYLEDHEYRAESGMRGRQVRRAPSWQLLTRLRTVFNIRATDGVVETQWWSDAHLGPRIQSWWQGPWFAWHGICMRKM